MIQRFAKTEIAELLNEFPAVGVLGPRQIGKTTLAKEIAVSINPKPVYLDMENPVDMAKLNDPQHYFELNKGKLIILDEIQRFPELFSVLRVVIDQRRQEGFRSGQFLILGSASLDLLQQSSETLAGRIAYQELAGLTVAEINNQQTLEQDKLWLRGGFPDSFLANNDNASMRWRANFINTYLERDIPQFGARIPAVTLRRLWTMLSHQQGCQVNFAQLGASLETSASSVKRYVELLEDLLLVRTLRPWNGNIGKRLVKAPKVYIRDSGITHALLNLKNLDDILGHSVAGGSWEGFVIENILSVLPVGITPMFYRSAAGAEIDLVLEVNTESIIAIEIKRSSSPKISKGFHLGCEDIGAANRYIVYQGFDRFPISKNVTALSLMDMMVEVRKLR